MKGASGKALHVTVVRPQNEVGKYGRAYCYPETQYSHEGSKNSWPPRDQPISQEKRKKQNKSGEDRKNLNAFSERAKESIEQHGQDKSLTGAGQSKPEQSVL